MHLTNAVIQIWQLHALLPLNFLSDVELDKGPPILCEGWKISIRKAITNSTFYMIIKSDGHT